MSPSDPAGSSTSAAVYWLPLVALGMHVLEELPSFPAWATARFGTTTPAWFVLSHIPLLAIAAVISWHGSRPARTPRAVSWLLVLLSSLFANAIFHLATSILWREYSPGVVSAVVLYLPVTVLLAPRLVRAVGFVRTGWAVVLGFLIAACFVGTLWFDIPVGRAG